MPDKKRKQSTLPWAPPPKLLLLDTSSELINNEAYSKYLYKDPKHGRTKYFNDILPEIYKHAHPYLQERFHNYIFSEREKRFQTKKLIEKVNHDMNVLFCAENEASCFKFLSIDSLSLKNKHVEIISKGVSKLEELLSKVEKEEKAIKANMETLFHKNKVKAWAIEQYQYTKTTVEQLGHLKADVHDKLEKLLNKRQSFDRVFKGIPLPNKKSIKSRKQKENKRKAGKRKEKRLKRIQEEIKHKIIELDSCTDNEDQSLITKAMLHLDELDHLRAHKHKAGLVALLENMNWDPAARKCVLAKITEWELDAHLEEDSEKEDERFDENFDEEEVVPAEEEVDLEKEDERLHKNVDEEKVAVIEEN